MPEGCGGTAALADTSNAAGAAAVPEAVAGSGQVPEIAASAVLVPSEELPAGSSVVKVRCMQVFFR